MALSAGGGHRAAARPHYGGLRPLRLEVLGTAAHAAEPHLEVDAIVIGSEIDCALVQKLRREVNPFEPVSVSIGSFQTFGRYNVVCDRAVLDGTVQDHQ